jgi:hypothetical protein
VTVSIRIAILAPLLASALACAGPAMPHDPNDIDVTLPASADRVKTTVVQVVRDGEYDVARKDDQTLTTGYREEMLGPWDWLLRWRFGTGRSRVEANVTLATEQTTRLQLSVQYEGKDGLFTRWEDSPTALPQSAENQLQLIKNALQIL